MVEEVVGEGLGAGGWWLGDVRRLKLSEWPCGSIAPEGFRKE